MSPCQSLVVQCQAASVCVPLTDSIQEELHWSILVDLVDGETLVDDTPLDLQGDDTHKDNSSRGEVVQTMDARLCSVHWFPPTTSIAKLQSWIL